MTRPPSDLRARVLDAARRAPSPTRAEATRRTALAALAGALAAVVAFAMLGGMTHARPLGAVAAVALGATLMAMVATWGAIARGRSMLGRPRATLAGIAVASPIALLAWSIVAASVGEPVAMAGGGVAQHVTCFACTAMFALGPLAAMAYARRGSDPVHPRALGGALGAAAGAWGGMLIDVHCPLATVEHLALGHALPIAALALVGALLGRAVLGVRAR